MLKILYLEDDENDALLLRYLLDAMDPTGYDLCTVSSQQQALATLAHGYFDLVISDYRLPQSDGCFADSFVRTVVGSNDYIPVILLTTEIGGIDPETRALIDKGRIDLLSKDELNPPTLQRVFNRILAERFSVLLLDDDEDYHQLVEKYLEFSSYKFEIVHAFREFDAINALDRRVFDLLLIDWDIGGNTALSLVRKLVQENPHGRIVLLTESSMDDLTEEIFDLHASGRIAYLGKADIDLNSFADTVLSLLFQAKNERPPGQAFGNA